MGFVVVTVASNGVVHAWGRGKLGLGEDGGEPFETRDEAISLAGKWKRADDRDPDQPEDGITVSHHVCKILGNESSDPEPV